MGPFISEPYFLLITPWKGGWIIKSIHSFHKQIFTEALYWVLGAKKGTRQM